MSNDHSLFSGTPEVTVLDNRGLGVRSIGYYRHPDTLDETDERITFHVFDARGFLAHSTDPRLAGQQEQDDAISANVSSLSTLAGDVLCTDSVDAGRTISLNDIAGRPFLSISATGVRCCWHYEDSSLPGRLLRITEQAREDKTRITERFVWAGNSTQEKNSNLAGQCVCHFDTAGLIQTDSIGLGGAPLGITRRLLAQDAEADWQGSDRRAWEKLLATDAYTTRTSMDAAGAPLSHADAMGNRQCLAYDVAGQLKASWLTVKGGREQEIIRSLTYCAAGRKLREEHGNGVVTTYRYEPQTLRLAGMRTERPAGHAAGARVLQELCYQYDPVGNVVRITNTAETARFWRNQQVAPGNTYSYDSLYQLVKATGREMAGIAKEGLNLPSVRAPLPDDSSAYTAWSRSYSYDKAGNLTRLRHNAPAARNSYTTDITVSRRSNRAVSASLADSPARVEALFDAGGRQLQLQPGQSLAWTARGELMQVTPVVREGQLSDSETYRYDSASQRVAKYSIRQTGGAAHTRGVIYLPGLELRTWQYGGRLKEALHVITVGEAGRAQVRALHWQTGKPEDADNDCLRYSYDNLVGSSMLEVDGAGRIISQEEYYPYGGTAVWIARSQVEAAYRTIRYNGKERDATGLYYYGHRYYQPWTARWLGADPAGTFDGLNLFRMAHNNPVTLKDPNGLAPEDENTPEARSKNRPRRRSRWRRALAAARRLINSIAGRARNTEGASGGDPGPANLGDQPPPEMEHARAAAARGGSRHLPGTGPENQPGTSGSQPVVQKKLHILRTASVLSLSTRFSEDTMTYRNTRTNDFVKVFGGVRQYTEDGSLKQFPAGGLDLGNANGYVSNFAGKGEPALVLDGESEGMLAYHQSIVDREDGDMIGFYNKFDLAMHIRFTYGIDLFREADDRPLHLIACCATGEGGSAQQLADVLRREVISYGPPGTLVTVVGYIPILLKKGELYSHDDVRGKLLKPYRYFPSENTRL